MDSTKISKYRFGVIGGGASGFAAAITHANLNPSAKTVILEGGQRALRKVSAAGNGQGNIANTRLSPMRYHGGGAPMTEKVFERVPLSRILSYYEECGIACKEEENGRIYPKSLQAASVTDCLRMRASELGIEEFVSFKAINIEKTEGGYNIYSEDKKAVFAENVAVACGGTASPHLSCGTGYDLLKKFGHKATALLPSLVQLKADREKIKLLKGLRFEAALTLISDGKAQSTENGDVLFTEYGISGTAVFSLSPLTARSLSGEKETLISIDFMPEVSAKSLEEKLLARQSALGGRTAENFLTGFIAKQLAKSCLQAEGIPTEKQTGKLSASEISGIVRQIKGFTLKITGSLGFDTAQVTAGGISLDGFDENLMSKYAKGLYACGEILDVDGDCGGFNLMWAAASGIVCGESAARGKGNK